MLVGRIENLGNENAYPKIVLKALNIIKSTDFDNKEVGVYSLEDGLVMQVIRTKTEARELRKPEVHRKNIDLQYLIKGRSQIGHYVDLGDEVVDFQDLENRDIIFYKNNEDRAETRIQMEEGSFAVFYPEDVHIPSIKYGEEQEIYKVVIKIPVDKI